MKMTLRLQQFFEKQQWETLKARKSSIAAPNLVNA